MRQFFKYCLGMAIIILQVFIGREAFFQQPVTEEMNTLEELLDSKASVADKLSPEEWRYLSTNPVINVGVDPNFYPIETFDERGRYTGLASDYLRLLEKMTGLKFKISRQPDWAATEEMARQGKIDMFMAAASTGRRNDFMLFTAPYVNLPGVIMTRRGGGLDEAGIEDLKGKKVAVTQDYSWHDYLKEFHPEITLVTAPTTLEALQLVADGEADAIVDYEFNLMEKIQTAGILQMQTAGTIDSSYGHAIATRKDQPQLFSIITMAMSQITPQERAALAKKWLERARSADEDKRLQWLFFFFVEASLLCLCLSWYTRHATRREARRMAMECLRQLGR